MLAAERLAPGRGMDRAGNRLTWSAEAGSLPDGTVILIDDHDPVLLWKEASYRFAFSGWMPLGHRPKGRVSVLTPPTSVGALGNGFIPELHDSVPEPAG
jgi:hypothetical protein